VIECLGIRSAGHIAERIEVCQGTEVDLIVDDDHAFIVVLKKKKPEVSDDQQQ
jgi:antitoxin MazE